MENQTKETITLYHGTEPVNVFRIMKEGIKAGEDGYIYFCKTMNDCCQYSLLYNHGRKHEVAIIPVEFSMQEFKEMGVNIDNAQGITPDAYAYNGDIPASRVPHSLNEIPKKVVFYEDNEN